MSKRRTIDKTGFFREYRALCLKYNMHIAEMGPLGEHRMFIRTQQDDLSLDGSGFPSDAGWKCWLEDHLEEVAVSL